MKTRCPSLLIANCILLMLVGCGNKLSRQHALEVLKSVPSEDLTRIIRTEHIIYGKHGDDRHREELFQRYPCVRELQESGFASNLRIVGRKASGSRRVPKEIVGFRIDLDLTDEAKQLVLRKLQVRDPVYSGSTNQAIEVLAARREVVRVTGISKPAPAAGQTISQVRFAWRYTPTVLFDLCRRGAHVRVDRFGVTHPARSEPDLAQQAGSATFGLFDDGWRLDSSSVRWQ